MNNWTIFLNYILIYDIDHWKAAKGQIQNEMK